MLASVTMRKREEEMDWTLTHNRDRGITKLQMSKEEIQ